MTKERLPEELHGHQWALPEGIEVPPDEIKARLDFYNDSIILYLIEKGVIKTKMVSARELTLALLREVSLSSGILPPDALWWKQGREGQEVALWRPPKVWPVAIQLEAFKPPRRLKVPMPGLIFVCAAGRPPSVFAVKKKPTSIKQVIYHAPLFNVFRDGKTCPGTHHYPPDIKEIPESFFTSFFTREAIYGGRSNKYPDNLLLLWEELDGRKAYPLKDLVPWGHVEDIL